MAAGNVVNIIVQALDQASKPLQGIQQQLQQTAQVAQQAGAAMAVSTGQWREGLSGARTAVSALASVTSNLSSVLRVTGVGGEVLGEKMTAVAIAISTATIAVQGIRAALVGLPPVFATVAAAARVAWLAVTGPIGLAIAGLALLTAGVVLVVRHFQAKAAAARQAADALELATKASWGLTQGLAATTSRMQEFKLTTDQVADSINKVNAELARARFDDAAHAVGAWQARQEALASTLNTTRDQLGRLIVVKREAIARLQQLAEASGLTADEKKQLARSVEGLQNELIRLNSQYAKEAAALTHVRETMTLVGAEQAAFAVTLARTRDAWVAETAAAFAAQRVMERTPDILKQIREGLEAIRTRALPVIEEMSVLMARATAALNAWRAALIRPLGPSLLDELRANNLALLQKALEQATTALQAWKAAMIQPIGESLTTSLRRANEALNVSGQRMAALRQIFAQSFAEMAVGLRSFSDFFSTVWTAIQQAFASVLAKMLERWIITHKVMQSMSSIFKSVFSFIPIFGPILSAILPFQHGGLVTRPTVGLLGESGPELVTPLSELGGLMGAGAGGGPTVIINYPTIVGDFGAWEFTKMIDERIRKSQRRESVRSPRTLGRPAAAWTGGGDPSHTSFKNLRR